MGDSLQTSLRKDSSQASSKILSVYCIQLSSTKSQTCTSVINRPRRLSPSFSTMTFLLFLGQLFRHCKGSLPARMKTSKDSTIPQDFLTFGVPWKDMKSTCTSQVLGAQLGYRIFLEHDSKCGLTVQQRPDPTTANHQVNQETII